MSNLANKFKTLFVKQKKDGKSFVWEYFGSLCDRADCKVTDTMNVYCIECFNDEKIKVYKETVSTTNLSQHLRDCHRILYQQLT
jgi:hypothetical protein